MYKCITGYLLFTLLCLSLCRWNSLKAELKDKDRRLLLAEGQVSDMQARLGEAVTQRKHWEAEYNVSKFSRHVHSVRFQGRWHSCYMHCSSSDNAAVASQPPARPPAHN